jgi:DNA polymerase III subunit epsilon
MTVQYVIFDLETTGLSPAKDAILEIGAMVVSNGVVTDEVFERFVQPGRSIPWFITRINGITDAMVRGADRIDQVLPEFLEFVAGRTLVAHNASFDLGFVQHNANRLGLEAPVRALCTVELSRRVFPLERSHSLDAVCDRLGFKPTTRHRALADVELTAMAFLEFQKRLVQARAS